MKIQYATTRVVLLLLIFFLGTACGLTSSPAVKPVAAPTLTPGFSVSETTFPSLPEASPTEESEFSVDELPGQPLPEATRDDGLPTIQAAQLPPEALDTIRLIVQGGPFPYRQDGTVFSNREGLLPDQQQGYYHEYTVKTPGASDRGARRLVVGEGSELYYTDDHYASFKRVVK